ncbi:peptidase G1 [Boletus edulis]|uniref:Peptidase G1 n=1 Tax=Boletus edulis BED1 TaxID=1328754 RepID=A0AAD4BLT4_BOLED|nr:peptidase G1 [Boletus edulis]KAF8434312.1 peptidase G1 [Boletus edulis BED1]
MRFNSVLISNFLFASVALAGRPRSQRQDLVEKRASASSDALTYADRWAGAVWKQAAGTFNFVTGAVTVPHISGPTKSSISVALGIDGFSCPNSAVLQAGFDGIVTQDGPLYEAWWNFNDQNYINLTISAGDVIELTVKALSETSGHVIIQNVNNGQNFTQQVESSGALCEQNAGWNIGLVTTGNRLNTWLPLAEFGTLAFTGAVATSNSGHNYGPKGADMIGEIEQNGQVRTSVSVDDNSVTINYV